MYDIDKQDPATNRACAFMPLRAVTKLPIRQKVDNYMCALPVEIICRYMSELHNTRGVQKKGFQVDQEGGQENKEI